MKLGAIILIGLAIFAAGTAGGAIAAFKINAERIERLTGEKTSAIEQRDTAIETSEATADMALALIAGQKRISEMMGDIARDLQARNAAERAIGAAVRRAPPEDNGPVPKVVRDTVHALYASEGQPQ